MTATACAVTAAFAIAGCGGDGDATDGEPSSSVSPTHQADPYQRAPWRLQVVNLLDALRTPEDGKYRNWLADDATIDTSFVYAPRRTGDPGWAKRDHSGAAVVYPAEMGPAAKKAFFNALTRDNAVIAATLTVLDPKGETVTGDNSYAFTFKVKTTQGNWLTGTASGTPGTSASSGHITELLYDVKPSS